MSALSSVLVGGMVLFLLLANYAQISLMFMDEFLAINELQSSSENQKRYKVALSDLILTSETALLSVSLSEAVSLKEFRSSDVFVACVDPNNNTRVLLAKYGDDWRILDIGLEGGGEVLNPSDPASMTGWIDPGERVKLEVSLPDACNSSRQVVLVFASLSGDVGVISGVGGG